MVQNFEPGKESNRCCHQAWKPILPRALQKRESVNATKKNIEMLWHKAMDKLVSNILKFWQTVN